MPRHSLTTLLYYGLFGLPLALVALPIYVYVPQFYAERFGLSLSLIGATLLAARVLDAFIDPALGWWIDQRKTGTGYARFIVLALPPLLLGFIALFHPLPIAQAYPLHWFLSTLLLVYFGFSLATIAYQSWGAALTHEPLQRARVTATREACGLIGVIVAAGVSAGFGMTWLSAIFGVTLIAGAALLLHKAPPASISFSPSSEAKTGWLLPFRHGRFRWLFAVFIVNGIAAAIPATLFLFFVKDQLRLAQYAGLFLMLYFAAAAASMPLWVRLAQGMGEARAWLLAMLLAAAVFIWTWCLPAGAAASFGLICLLSGATLGADLALPSALLAAVIARAGHSGQHEGAYFGAWNWATKMNLALAAGISLPLLERLGYVPGVPANDTHALIWAYAVVPCLLKLVAAAILWRAPLRSI